MSDRTIDPWLSDRRDFLIDRAYRDNAGLGRHVVEGKRDFVVCPAGEQIDGASPDKAGCHCRIDNSVLYIHTEPGTIELACASNYTGCGTWRNNKKGSRECGRAWTQDAAGILYETKFDSSLPVSNE